MSKADRTRPEAFPVAFDNRRVLVTGASRGIGRETSIRLSRLGAQLTLNGRDVSSLETTRAALDGTGHVIAARDLADANGLHRWIVDLAEQHGPFNGMAHCAGLQANQPVRAFSMAFFDEIMHANLASAFGLTRGLRHQKARGDPLAIVFVSSIAGLVGLPANVVYGASKAGLMAATRGFAMELLRDKIRVNCVAPALVETEMVKKARVTMPAAQFQSMLDQHPMGIGEPSDVANAIIFLLSDASQWINGVTLSVDGGSLAR